MGLGPGWTLRLRLKDITFAALNARTGLVYHEYAVNPLIKYPLVASTCFGICSPYVFT